MPLGPSPTPLTLTSELASLHHESSSDPTPVPAPAPLATSVSPARVAGEDDEEGDNPLPAVPDFGIEIDARVTIGDLKNGYLRFYGK